MPPMPPDFLQQLLARRDTWWGRESTGTGQGQNTGFNDLDRILAGGGWPEQGLVELLCPLPCPAVLHLLLPVLASDGPGARLIANPPMRPSATMLARAGVPLDDLLILRSDDRATLLRASFEAIAGDTVRLALLWAPGGPLPAGTLRRLHLGAQQGRCLLILVRPRQAGRQPSPAPLRLDLSCPAPGELTVTVHKQPGGRAGLHCRLPLLPEHLRRRPPACRELPALTRRPAPEPALRTPLLRLPAPVVPEVRP